MHPDVEEILYTEEQIAQRVRELGAQITADYAGEEVVVISVLRGAAIYMADLVRAMDLPLEMDFMTVSSYGSGAVSSGRVQIVKDLSSDISGKHVLIAEDILDSGLTLSYLMDLLQKRNPASIEIAALLLKKGAQKVPVTCKYVGFECEDAFIVGYGLDYDEHYRNLPYIGALKPEVYTK